MSSDDDAEVSEEPMGCVVSFDRPIEVARVSPREYRIPLILLEGGFVVWLAATIATHGGAGALAAGKTLSLVFLVQIPLMIAGLHLLAALLGISYGLLQSAILKLAAITLLGLGLSGLGEAVGHPIIALLAVVPLSWFLFGFLFELDPWETLVSVFGFCFLGSMLERLF
jgi:hypothetical protein